MSALVAESSEYDYLVKLLLIGDERVGKTQLLSRYTDDSFVGADSYKATIGVDFKLKSVSVNGKKIKLQLWDTAGQERFRTITTAYYRGCGGALICFDVCERESFEHARKWHSEAAENGVKTFILVGCQVDRQAERVVASAEIQAMAEELDALSCEVSAKTGEGVSSCFELLSEKATNELIRTAAGDPKGRLTPQQPASGFNYVKLVLDLVIFTVCMTSLDVGSDILAVRTYFASNLMFFFTIGMALLVCPMVFCWAYLWSMGKAQWYEAPLYVFQVKMLQEVFKAVREGKKAFGLLFINVCEVCFESFPQSLLATYSLLIGMQMKKSGVFGLTAAQVIEASVICSWMSAAKFVATIDEYDPDTELFHKNSFMLTLARMAFRFSEVASRVLSLAFFAATMRPRSAGAHDNVQVAIWVLLAVEYLVYYILTVFHARPTKSAWIFAAICMLCAPMHFMKEFRKSLPLFYAIRAAGMLIMMGVAYYVRHAHVIAEIARRDDVLFYAGAVSSAVFLSGLLLNALLSCVLPQSRLARSDDLIGRPDEGSWLIVPLELPKSYERLADVELQEALK